MNLDDPIIRADAIGTGVFTVAAAAGVAAPDTLGIGAAVIDGILFALGCVAFVATLLRIAERSRTEALHLPGVWWLSGSAPREVRRALLGLFCLQVVVALVAASVRPFTALAFGVLAPVFGLGLIGLWAARHGAFPPRAGSSSGSPNV